MSADSYDASEEGARASLKSSESTAFYLWLLITVSAGIIMAQDSWVSMQQPRLDTVDATAAFTKLMVIHAIWLIVTVAFMAFTWFVRPTSAWKIHMVVGAMTVIWTVGVLVWSFADVERLRVSTWRCDSAPATDTVTEAFLATCEKADMGSTIRLGDDIFLWSADDEHYWRWIIPGEGMSTLQTRWPSQASAMYLATNDANAPLIEGAENSIPGGNWSAGFDPNQTRSMRIFFIESTPSDTTSPLEESTPHAVRRVPAQAEHIHHEKLRLTT